MDQSYLYLGIFLTLLGIVIKHFKLYFLIAGYNTMSKKEKEKVKIEKVAILFRNVLIFIGLSLVIMSLATLYIDNPEITNYLFFAIILGSVIFLLVKSNSSKYKK